MDKITQFYTELFNNRDFYHQMLKLAIPIMIQNFISSFLNMVDTVMVGKLGEPEIAAVGIANQYFLFFNMFVFGMCAGCSVFISQFWGKRDFSNIKRIIGVGLASAATISLVFMFVGWLVPEKVIGLFNDDPQVIRLAVGYLRIVLTSYLFTGITFVYNFSLRSIGNTVQPMIVSGLALLCNACFNYLFIFGKLGAPAMGVDGAALATVIARVFEAVVLVGSIYWAKSTLAASVAELTDLTPEFVKKAYRIILPVIFNDISWGLGVMVYAAVYGRMGIQAVAVVQICNTVSNLFMVAIFGMSSAASVMVGNSIGAGDEALGRSYAKKFSLLGVAAGLGLGLLLAAASPLFLSLFNVSSGARREAQIILYIIALVYFIRVFDIILIVGILRGGGDAKWALLIEGFTMWFIGVPLTILGAFFFRLPVSSVYALAILEEIAKCILGVIRLKSGRWLKNVTHNMA